MQPKILILDIETAPVIGTVWSLWNQNLGISQILEDWYILTYSAKWLGRKEVMFDSLYRHRDVYKADKTDDSILLGSLWTLLDEADIIVAHNGDRFDVPKINARFLKHGYPPPSPFQKIDTLKVAKRNFRLTSNKLDYIAQYLGHGAKLQTDMTLWIGCMEGDPQSWKDMVKYNIQDVKLLEKVYLQLLPWIHNHPNMGLYLEKEKPVCPKCGSENIQWRGYQHTPMNKYRRFACTDCGGWGRERVTALPKEVRKSLTSNVVT